jgi:hypothetical protein
MKIIGTFNFNLQAIQVLLLQHILIRNQIKIKMSLNTIFDKKHNTIHNFKHNKLMVQTLLKRKYTKKLLNISLFLSVKTINGVYF